MSHIRDIFKKNSHFLFYTAQFGAYLSGFIICFLNLPQFSNYKSLHIAEFSNLLCLIILIIFFTVFNRRKYVRLCIIISIACFCLAIISTFIYISDEAKYTTKWQGETFLVGLTKNIKPEVKQQLSKISEAGEKPYTVNELLDINAGNVDDYWSKDELRKAYIRLLLEYTLIFIFFILSLVSALQGFKCSKQN